MGEHVVPNGLAVYTLGRFEVRVDERVLLDRTWSRSKAKALLKLLALQSGHSMLREQVLDALWPDLDPAAAANQLHKNLHYLRAVLAEQGISVPLVTTAGDVLALAPDVWIDIQAFRQEAARARAARDDLALYERALALYGGDLLPDDLYEDWTEPAREELRSLRLQLLAELSRLCEVRGDLEAAITHLQQIVQADPLHEDAHRGLMRLYAQSGSRHRALRQYQACRAALERELGVEPASETEALHREILEGRLPEVGTHASDAGTRGRGGAENGNIPMPPRPRVPASNSSPLYGREQESKLADRVLEQALHGHGLALFVGGVAGIGKSCFAERILAAAEERGALVLLGRGYEMEATIAYQPVRDVLRQALHQAGEDAGHLVHRSLHLRRLLPESRAEAPPSADPALLQLELFDEAAQFFTTLAARRPVVLSFDDLHAADEASLRLVHFLCRNLAPHALLLVATYRLEEATANRRLAELLVSLRRERLLTEIELAPLDKQAMQRLIQAHFDGQPVDPPLLTSIAAQAEGNPLFAHQLVQTLKEEGRVSFADGRWQERGAQSAAVPVAVQELLSRRLQRLGDETVRMLHVAAVLGRSFDYGVLRRAAQLPEPALLDALDAAIAAFILEEAPQGYRFRHDLLREGIHARLTRARRQQLHRTLAEALTELPARGPEPEAEVAYHFAESDEPWRAIPFLQSAARRAAAVYANEQAIALYEQALVILSEYATSASPAERAALLEELGDLKNRLGRTAESVALFERALALASDSGDEQAVFRLRGKAALGHITDGNARLAAELLEATLQAMTDRSPQSVVSRTYYLLAQLHWHNAQHHEALEAAEKALLAAESSGDPEQQSRAYEVLALACHSLGDWQKGVEYELSRHGLGLSGFDTDEAFDAHL